MRKILILVIVTIPLLAEAQSLKVVSPEGHNTITITPNGNDEFEYTVTRDDKQIVTSH